MPSRTKSNELTAYEAEQVAQIVAWKSKPLNPIAEAWNLTVLQAAKLVTLLIPEALVRSAIESSYDAAQKFAAPASIARKAARAAHRRAEKQTSGGVRPAGSQGKHCCPDFRYR